MNSTITPTAKKYLETFASYKHKGFINLHDAQCALYIAFAEGEIEMAEALKIEGAEVDKVRNQLNEFKRLFNLNQKQ